MENTHVYRTGIENSPVILTIFDLHNNNLQQYYKQSSKY